MAIALGRYYKNAKNKRETWKEIKKHKSIYLFISPFFILFAVFGLFPILFSVYLAFQSWDGLAPMRFVGLANFRFLLSDPIFWLSIENDFIIWIESTIPMLLIALVLACLLNSALVRWRGFWRFAFFLPNITSIVAEAVVFGALFATKYGLLNYLLGKMGLPTVDWLNSNWSIQVVIALMTIWRWTGYNVIIFLAGLQAIPEDLYEAARIDGASSATIFTRITIPLLRPTVLFAVIMSTIGNMQIFTEPQVLTGGTGGPGQGGLTTVLYIYNEAFTNHLFGYSSAVSWGLFVIIGMFSLLNMILVRKISY